MFHLWALTSTLVLSVSTVVSGTGPATAAAPAHDHTGQASGTVAPGSLALAPLHPANGFYWQLTTPQEVLPGTVLVAHRGTGHVARGTRSDTQFFQISSTGSNDVPEAALRAYHHAERVMATSDPGCDISWTLLAAIGRVESNHGRFGGAQLGSDGVSRPEIRGPRLDGTGAFAAIRDSDGGRLDHDKAWDRAVGQMQFLPETWRAVARDGDGDGKLNPDDIDDSALGSAVYLCGAGGSLANPEGAARAAFRYNHSDYYVSLVLSFQTGYQTGVFALPSPPPPPETAKPSRPKAVKPRHVTRPRTPKHHTSPAPVSKPHVPVAHPTPSPKPAPTPTTPKPTPAPTLTKVTGTWKTCGADFCLDDTHLDLAPLVPAVQRDDLLAMVGSTVTLQVEQGKVYKVHQIVDVRKPAPSLAPSPASPTATP